MFFLSLHHPRGIKIQLSSSQRLRFLSSKVRHHLFKMLLLLPFVIAAVAAKNVAGVVNLQFESHNPSQKDSSNGNKHTPNIFGPRPLNLDKREDEVEGTLFAELSREESFYSVPLKFGSNQDEVIVLLDTGSSDLWVSGSNNAYCRPGTNVSISSASSSSRRRSTVKGKTSPHFDSPNIAIPIPVKLTTPAKKYKVIDDESSFKAHIGQGQGQGDSPALKPSKSLQNKDVPYTDSYVYPTMDCSEYGTFNHELSSSFRSNNTPFYISYADDTYAFGEWGYDTVLMHDLEIKDLSFAVANQSDSEMAVLGIGLEGLESTNVGYYSNISEPYTYDNLPSKLVSDGLINRRVYSLYLDSENATSGSLLFGGVDHEKYEGTLQLVPLINTYYGILEKPVRFEITVSNIIVSAAGSEPIEILTSQFYANLDSGTTFTYMPTRMLDAVASSFNLTYSYYSGVYYTTCPSDAQLAGMALTFDFQGIKIEVPLKNLFIEDTGSYNCIFTVLDGGSQGIVLGANFLRSAYVVYDLDNYQIGLAQAKYTNDTNVEVISSDIPGATSVSDFDKTLDVEGIVSSYDATNTLSAGSSSRTRTASSSSSSSSSSNSDRSGSSNDAKALNVSFGHVFAVILFTAGLVSL